MKSLFFLMFKHAPVLTASVQLMTETGAMTTSLHSAMCIHAPVLVASLTARGGSLAITLAHKLSASAETASVLIITKAASVHFLDF